MVSGCLPITGWTYQLPTISNPNGKYESSLNFSVFNVYNRANPFLIFFDIQGDIVEDHNLSITAKQISIFPIIPSISWNLKF